MKLKHQNLKNKLNHKLFFKHNQPLRIQSIHKKVKRKRQANKKNQLQRKKKWRKFSISIVLAQTAVWKLDFGMMALIVQSATTR